MASTNFIKMDESTRIKAFFGDLLDFTNKRIWAATRHGVSEALNLVKQKTIANIAAIPYRMTTPTKMYGVPLIAGVKAYLYKGQATGFVDILGTRGANDGTWMLRWAAGRGTKQRTSKSGRNLGAITGYYALANAASSIGSDAATEIQKSIQSAIDEINNK